jgi:hypothetical protein
VSLHAVERYEEAATQYLRATALDPKHGAAHSSAMAILAQLGRCGEVEALNRAARNITFDERGTKKVEWSVRRCASRS